MLQTIAVGLAVLFAGDAFQADGPVDKAPRRQDRLASSTYQFGGPAARYAEAVAKEWLLPAPNANPALLDMFRDRDRRPYRQMEPWAGEFAGKYLTAAVQVLRLRDDQALRDGVANFVKELVALQEADGYLGPWPKDSRLTGRAPNASGKSTWDAWGHYHVMLGLLLWREEAKDDAAALAAARKIGDLFCDRFLGDKKPRLVDTGSTEMNLAPAHGLCLLYRATSEPKYLQLAKQIVDDEFAAKDKNGKPLAGDWLNEGLSGKEFFQGPKPRWESLHPIMAMAELYQLTGEERYRKAFEQVWWSIVKLDRHNNGGFSSGEQAQGNPYHQGAIETCCTIAWLAMSVEMLRMTGNPIVADELELTTLNSGLGLWSPSGRWATYNTPMDGVRKASAHEIVFQAREGSPELNCCSVNAPRALGMIPDWAVMSDADGYVVNWFGEGGGWVQQHELPNIEIQQVTNYPNSAEVKISVEPDTIVPQEKDLTIKFRIPRWSKRTEVKFYRKWNPGGLKSTPERIDDQFVQHPAAGTYFPIKRRWKRGDTIELSFDFSPHFWVGERECAGKTSVYRGPMLLTWDRRFNIADTPDGVALRARDFPGKAIPWDGPRPPMLLFEVPGPNGTKVRLCDFASAGQGGSPYRSWLPVEGATSTPFSRENPLRSSPVAARP